MARPAFKVQIRGARGMEKALRKLRSQALTELKKKLPGAAAGLMLGASAGTPVESGELFSSAFVGKPFSRRSMVGIRAGYQSEIAPAVHEGFHGGRKVGSPKSNWFSDAFYAYRPHYLRFFKRAMQLAFARASRAKGAGGLY